MGRVHQFRPVNLSVPSRELWEIVAGRLSTYRWVLMTAVATDVGSLPILFVDGTGSRIMSRLAAPRVGGMISTALLILLALPAIYLLWKQRNLRNTDS